MKEQQYLHRCNGSIILVFLVVALGFALVIGKLAYLQLIDADTILSRIYEHKPTIEFMDGLIKAGVFHLDENGQLAIDRDLLVRLVPNEKRQQFVLDLARFVKADDGLVTFERSAVRVRNLRQFYGESKVRRGSVLDRNGNVLAETVTDQAGKTWRRYSLGAAALHVVGYDHALYGRKGIERLCDPWLNGSAVKGKDRMKLNTLLRTRRRGADVVTTLDSRVQQKAYELMGSFTGAAVALDCRTGAVLAMVSKPSFDLTQADETKWRAAAKGSEQPLLNRAIDSLYPPGSTFKIVVASALLESGKDVTRRVECTGGYNQYKIHCQNGHGSVDVHRAIVKSCNVFFSGVGADLGVAVRDMAEKYGFGYALDISGLDSESPWRAEASMAFSWREFTSLLDGTRKSRYVAPVIRRFTQRDFSSNRRGVAQCSIGQNKVESSPLQMAMVAAAVANGGRLMHPRLLERIVVPKTKPANDFPADIQTLDFLARVVSEPTPETQEASDDVIAESKLFSTPLSAVNALAIRRDMAEMTTAGTGHSLPRIMRIDARVETVAKSLAPKTTGELISFGGKTGTAQVVRIDPETGKELKLEAHSWFIGFAPADDPTVAVAVLCEHGGYGALAAGPIGVGILAEALN